MRKSELVKAIKAEYLEEADVKLTVTSAEVIIDRRCEAFVQRWSGVGPDYAVREDPEIGEYLLNVWKGEEKDRLREARRRWMDGVAARF